MREERSILLICEHRNANSNKADREKDQLNIVTACFHGFTIEI